jgi:hypothetical protein
MRPCQAERVDQCLSLGDPVNPLDDALALGVCTIACEEAFEKVWIDMVFHARHPSCRLAVTTTKPPRTLQT